MYILFFVVALSCLLTFVEPAHASAVEAIIVDKSERKLWLVRNGEKDEEFDIRLGQNPEGHKQQRGDKKTPEGRYYIEWRNPQSKFYRSFKISYPSPKDRALAKLKMRDPGDNIFIHGTKNGLSAQQASEAQNYDWTLGCIALKNSDMDYLWDIIADGTPIDIHP